MKNINNLVYCSELEKENFLAECKEKGIECIPAIDARSAIYIASGIAAQNKLPVMVCINGSNASRSAFSGMTEAYYRNLPVILVTLGCELDYSTEINDITVKHITVNSFSDIFELETFAFPLHIEVLNLSVKCERMKCENIHHLISSAVDDNMYVYIGQGIQQYSNYKCKLVCGGLNGCYDGALANVLGASLAKKRSRYIGIVSEEEFKHDINTLGNRNINDRILYFVICSSENKLFFDYASSLGFETISINEKNLDSDMISSMLHNGKKSVIIIRKEQ